MYIGQVFNSDSPSYRWEIQKDGIRHQKNTYSYEDISEIELYTDTSIVLTLKNTNKVRLWFTPYDKEDMLALIQSVSNQKEPKGQTAIDSISKVSSEMDKFIGKVFMADDPYDKWEIQENGIRFKNKNYPYVDISKIDFFHNNTIALNLKDKSKIYLPFNPSEKEDVLALVDAFSNLKGRIASDHFISISNVIVTTADLKQDYDVISPVFFQTSNKTTLLFGSRWQDLVKKHSDRLQQTSIGYEGTIGDALHSLFVNTPGNTEFHKAFFIGVGELQEMALKIGADAIVGVKMDFDLDTTGWQYFYFQMYGTAVKLK